MTPENPPAQPPDLPVIAADEVLASRPAPPAEIIPPTRIILRTVQAAIPCGMQGSVMAALTAGALWLQDAWQLRRVALQDIGSIEATGDGKEVVLTLGSDNAAEKLTLIFASASAGQRWYQELNAQRQPLAADAPPPDGSVPEGIVLLKQGAYVPAQELDWVSFEAQTSWAADRGLQLRAGIRGANAVTRLRHRKVPGSRPHQSSGLAVRCENSADLLKLRQRSYRQELTGLVGRVLLLLVVQAGLLLCVSVLGPGISPIGEATGQTWEESLRQSALGLALIHAWPLVLVLAVWILQWPQLLRPLGLAVVAVTTGRGLTVLLMHAVAIAQARSPTGFGFCVFFDPVDWAIIIIGVVLGVRAWRLAADAGSILPSEAEGPSPTRRTVGRIALAGTGLFAIALVGFAGYARYQSSTYVLRPGVDPKREQQALLAFNDGVAAYRRNDLRSAEHSYRTSLQLWEELTRAPSVPPQYRVNLALTLYRLGALCHQQDKLDEAEQYYARAVAAGDEVAGDPQADPDFQTELAQARQSLQAVRAHNREQILEEKDRQANRKFEEAQVKDQKGEASADRLCQEAIALWEEVQPLASDERQQRYLAVRLATAYQVLAELLQERPPAEVEATVKKAIDYWEKAVALAPDRPLFKHNLEVARQKLDNLHEHALEEEIQKLCVAERFADAIDRYARSIEEQERLVETGKDRDAARRRLAYRLDRFAWFLAHCPDQRVRQTKEAVAHARRATQLQPSDASYWFTRAMAEYRNGDWRESLASLDQVKAHAGELDANDWFLTAMNLHRLKNRKEAADALRKATDWMQATQRKAEENPVLRFRFEMMRKSIEALQREARELIGGQDSSNDKVG